MRRSNGVDRSARPTSTRSYEALRPLARWASPSFATISCPFSTGSGPTSRCRSTTARRRCASRMAFSSGWIFRTERGSCPVGQRPIPARSSPNFAIGMRGSRTMRSGRIWPTFSRGLCLQPRPPAARAAGVRLAIHPDDPPWAVAGFPRIITSGNALRRVTQIVDSPANGVTLCTGSLGANPVEGAALPETIRGLAGRIYFVHARNVRVTGERSFHETAHPFGDRDLPAVIKALVDVGVDGPVRPDHGRMIWGEEGRPGYGLYDRALGAAYLRGLIDAQRMDHQGRK